MSASAFGKLGQSVSQLWNRLQGHSTRKSQRRHLRSRRLLLEPLETRSLCANDLATISGRVFKDATGNGFTAGEQLSGATVELFLDNGNGVFEPGAGDILQSTQTSDASGNYRFNRLTAAGYWVRQPAQVVGAVSLNLQTSALLTITALEAQGVAGRTVDSFLTIGPSINAAFPVGTTASGFQAAAESLGGERDLFAQLTDGLNALDDVSFQAGAGVLNWNADTNAEGRYVASWDGADGSGSALAQGLANIDLTDGGNSSFFRMAIFGTDKPNATAQLRVYSSAANFSQSVLTAIPELPAATGELLFDYAAFTTAGGTGVNFASVTAIELEIISNDAAMQGQVTFLGTIGPTVETQDFANFTPADLRIAKTVNNGSPNVGQNVIFSITVTNDGPNPTTNVTVSDPLPAGLTFVSSTPSQGTYVSGTGTWTVGSLAVAGSATLDITALVNTVGVKLNTAQVSASDQFDPDSTPNNSVSNEDDQATATVTPQSIDLQLTKTVDNATPNRNQNVTFTVGLSNVGTNGATNVAVQDLLPAGLTFVSSNPALGSYNSTTGLWTVGSLAAAATTSLQIVASVVTNGDKINTAQVSAADQTDVDSTPGNNNAAEDDQSSVTVTPRVADLRLAKTVDDATPDRNQNVTFTLTVTNDGPAAASSVAVADLLPAGLTFVSSTPSQGTYVSNTGVWTVGAIANGANATLQIVATTTTSAVKTNTAQISATDQFDSDSTPNNSLAGEDDQASVVVTPNVADLSVAKTVNDTTPDRNDNITFTVTLNNAGPAAATNVSVSDLLPTGLTFVSSTPSQGTYNNTTGTWTVGTVNAAQSPTLLIVATVVGSTVLTNSAQVSASDTFDNDSTPGNSVVGEDDQASVDVIPNVADLSVLKTVNNAAPDLNQNVTFTVTVANAGPATATNVSVTDILPATLTFVSATPSQGTYTNTTGVWTVGTVNNAASASLQITATVASVFPSTNTAQVSASSQFDPDSTPANNLAAEDDQRSVTVTPPRRFSKRQFLAE